MPLATYQIALLDDMGAPVGASTYSFEVLAGNIVRASEQPELFERRGVDGVGIRLTGVRPRPFQLVSVRLLDDFAAADTFLSDARALIGATYGVRIVQHSIDQDTFDVLNVDRSVPDRAIGLSVGSVNGGTPGVRQELVWNLIERYVAA